jgi:anti-sigma factor RsiW
MSLFDRLRRGRRARGPRGSPPLACQELVELITDYLEGALPDDDQIRFEQHIAGCPHCTAYLEQMRDTIRALGHLSEADIPDTAMDELLETFRAWKRT